MAPQVQPSASHDLRMDVPAPFHPRPFLAAWGLAEWPTTRLLGGEIKTLWRVDSPGRQHVLRVYPHYVDPAAVAAECSRLTRLAVELLEVPSPIPTTSGAAFVEIQGRCAALAPWVEGHLMDGRQARQRESFAEVLARFHRVSAGLGDDRQKGQFPALNALDWWSNSWWDIPTITHSQARTPLWQLVEPRLDQVAGVLARLAGLPRVLIHNDIGPENVIVHENRVAAMIDWDWLTLDWRAMDVAQAVEAFAGVSTRDFDPAIAREFVVAYRRSGGEFIDAEVAALAELLWLRLLWVGCYDLGRAAQGLLDDDALPYRVATFIRLDEQLAAWPALVTNRIRGRPRA
jgi:homoserine kinase type II